MKMEGVPGSNYVSGGSPKNRVDRFKDYINALWTRNKKISSPLTTRVSVNRIFTNKYTHDTDDISIFNGIEVEIIEQEYTTCNNTDRFSINDSQFKKGILQVTTTLDKDGKKCNSYSVELLENKTVISIDTKSPTHYFKLYTRVSEKPLDTNHRPIEIGTEVEIIEKQYTKIIYGYTISTDDSQFQKGILVKKEVKSPPEEAKSPLEGQGAVISYGGHGGTLTYVVKFKNDTIEFNDNPEKYFFKIKTVNVGGGKKRRKTKRKHKRKQRRKKTSRR